MSRDSTPGRARRAVALALVMAAAFLVQSPVAAGQDTIIVTTTITTTSIFGSGGLASADLLQGSAVLDGTSNTASTGGNSVLQLSLSGGDEGELALGSYTSASFGGQGGPGGPGGPGDPEGGGKSDDDNNINVLGKIRAFFTPRSKFDIKTPVAATSRRGTILTVEARSDWTRVRTYEGAVDFWNLHGTTRTVTVNAGYESIVRGATPPTKPKRFRVPRYPFWEPRHRR